MSLADGMAWEREFGELKAGLRRPADGWIQTYTGRQYWPHAPSPADVDINDIAHALSNICRYTGHCVRFYSVAEHSVHVSHIVPPELAMDGLLHDARETYVNDMATPTKRYLPDYQRLEEVNARVIALAFGISHPTPPAVKDADRLLYWHERRQLMMPTLAHAEPPALRELNLGILGLDPTSAKQHFLARFDAILATRC